MSKIIFLNPVLSKLDKDMARQLRDCLAYPGQYYIKKQYGNERRDYKAYYINRDSTFYSGLIPRLLSQARKKKLKLEVDYKNREILTPENDPAIKGIILRSDQLKLTNSATLSQRGIIQSPTGSGKTIIMAGIASCFPSCKQLILSHTLTIVNQTATKFKEYGFKDIAVITGERKGEFSKITISTIQTFSKFDPALYSTFFDIVYIDEAHHVAASQYGKVFDNLLSPMRIGFTATPQTDVKKQLVAEGYLGPIIGKLTIQEAGELNILAKPKVNLISIPENGSIKQLRSYNEIYKAAIINSNVRNLFIVEEVGKKKKENKTVLTLVKEIEHGNNLKILCKKLNIKVEFVQGKTDGEEREKIREAFDRKKFDCVIATAVWKEGIDIPSIDCVINACGGRSEIATLQAIGRGLRKTDKKDKVEVIDFLDPYKYLAIHTIQRLQIYVNNGWL